MSVLSRRFSASTQKLIGNPTRGSLFVKLRDLKKQLILTALEEAKDNYTEAARILGVHANYLHRLIHNLDLKESLRSSPDARSGIRKISGARR